MKIVIKLKEWLSDLGFFMLLTTLVLPSICEGKTHHSIAAFEVPAVLCPGIQVSFMNTSYIDAGDTATYSWYFAMANTENSSAKNGSAQWSSAGLKTVRLTVHLQNGDTSSITKTILINQAPIADFMWGETCSNSATPFYLKGYVPDSIKASFSWNINNESTSKLANPEFKFTSIGTKMISLEVTTTHGCFDSIRKTFEILEKPVLSFTANDVCVGDEMVFTNTTARTDVVYIWNFGDGKTDTSFHARHTYSVAQSYNVSLIGILEGGCTGTLIKPVFINQLPDAGFTVQVNKLTAYFKAAPGNDSYHWDFGDGNKGFSSEPVHTFLKYSAYVCLTTKKGICINQGCRDIYFYYGAINESNSSQAKINPNPSTGKVMITNTKGLYSLSVVNMLGEEQSFDHVGNEVDLSHLVDGVYFVRIVQDGNQVIQKLVLRR
jgi:PKD repeat protein